MVLRGVTRFGVGYEIRNGRLGLALEFEYPLPVICDELSGQCYEIATDTTAEWLLSIPSSLLGAPILRNRNPATIMPRD
jgi:hypothetical protein